VRSRIEAELRVDVEREALVRERVVKEDEPIEPLFVGVRGGPGRERLRRV
jgi:hypothetical protein